MSPPRDSQTMPLICLFALLCTPILVSEGKRLRLPILMRSPTIVCNFTNDDCGINNNLNQFVYHHNASNYIDGRCEYYLLQIKDHYVPIKVGKFETVYFPYLKDAFACFHVEYNVQGPSSFFFVVSQRKHSSYPQMISKRRVTHSARWQSLDIDIKFDNEKLMFIFEVICQWCSKNSAFSISRIGLSYEKCRRRS